MIYGAVAAADLRLTVPDIGYETAAVHFDGSTYLTRGEALTGWGSPSKFIAAIWIKLSDADDGIFSDANHFTQGTTTVDGSDYINFSVAGTYIDSSGITQITSGGWQCLLASMDLTNCPSSAELRLYIGNDPALSDNISLGSSTTIAAGSNFWLGQDGYGVKIIGDVADFRLWVGKYCDFNMEYKRRLFIRSNGRPADPTLATAALGTPIVSFIADLADPVGTFIVNGGSGGAFTLTGSLTTATSSPTGLNAEASFAGAGSFSIDTELHSVLLEASTSLVGIGSMSIDSAFVPRLIEASASFAGAGAFNANAWDPNWDDAATAFLARTSGLNAIHQNAYGDLITGLVADGVWSKLDALWVFATQNETTALLNLCSSSYGMSKTLSPTFTTDQGFAGDNTNYLDDGTALNVMSQYSQNSSHLMVWMLSGTATAGAIGDGAGDSHVLPRWTDNKAYFRINNSTGVNATVAAPKGCSLASRTSSVILKGYKNGTEVATSGASTAGAVSSNHITVPQAGSAATGVICAASVGAGLDGTEADALYDRLYTYLQAIGISSPT